MNEGKKRKKKKKKTIMDNIPLDSEVQSTGLDLFIKPEYCDNFASYQDVTIQPLHPPADSDHTTYSFTVGV